MAEGCQHEFAYECMASNDQQTGYLVKKHVQGSQIKKQVGIVTAVNNYFGYNSQNIYGRWSPSWIQKKTLIAIEMGWQEIAYRSMFRESGVMTALVFLVVTSLLALLRSRARAMPMDLVGILLILLRNRTCAVLVALVGILLTLLQNRATAVLVALAGGILIALIRNRASAVPVAIVGILLTPLQNRASAVLVALVGILLTPLRNRASAVPMTFVGILLALLRNRASTVLVALVGAFWTVDHSVALNDVWYDRCRGDAEEEEYDKRFYETHGRAKQLLNVSERVK